MLEWGSIASWVAFALSSIVAINQFGSSRPSLEIEPDRNADNQPPKFFLLVNNPTSVGVHLKGHRGTVRHIGYRLDMSASKEDQIKAGAESLQSGTINVLVPPGKTALLSLRVDEKKPLILLIHWRRLSGLHLFQFFPLFIVMRWSQVERAWRMQTKVEIVR